MGKGIYTSLVLARNKTPTPSLASYGTYVSRSHANGSSSPTIRDGYLGHSPQVHSFVSSCSNPLTCGDTGWTRAWITNIIAFNDLRPTVIETLIFWLASSLGIPGGFTIPEVCDELAYQTRRAHPCAAHDVMWEGNQKTAVLALSRIS